MKTLWWLWINDKRLQLGRKVFIPRTIRSVSAKLGMIHSTPPTRRIIGKTSHLVLYNSYRHNSHAKTAVVPQEQSKEVTTEGLDNHESTKGLYNFPVALPRQKGLYSDRIRSIYNRHAGEWSLTTVGHVTERIYMTTLVSQSRMENSLLKTQYFYWKMLISEKTRVRCLSQPIMVSKYVLLSLVLEKMHWHWHWLGLGIE